VYDTICAAQMTQNGDYSFRRLKDSGIKTLSAELLGYKRKTFTETTDGKPFDELDPQNPETIAYACEDADQALQLMRIFNDWFDKYLPRHRLIVENLESPTAVYLGIMKHNGAPLDVPLMEEKKQEAEIEMQKLREKIAFFIGDVNIGSNCSTKAFKEYLYGTLKLPVLKTTLTDREAADDQTMQMLKEWCDTSRPELSELFTLVQEYRKWGKIKSTYIDGYLKFLNPVTGCVHPDFFALSTDTGRFNCQHPNAQNMPRKTNDPIGVRNFIKAPDGHLIISLDFSQIELRVGAFYLSQAGDDTMREVYLNNLDLHAKTTSVIFGVPYEQAHDKNSPNYKEHRTIAKNVNFGVFYGLFPRGLQKTLKFKAGIDRSFEECSEMIENLKAGYPGLSVWQEEVKERASHRMYTQTWLGRRRYLPNINSTDWGQKSFSERCAMNTPIQGTAADILKMAVARILNGLPERPWLLPILQIHDELTFIIPEDKLSDAVSFVKRCMEEAPFPEFNLPLIAEASAGRTFGAMDELDG
jgi:DNA polymerase-1